MPIENISIGGFTDQPSKVNYNNLPEPGKRKLTIEERTELLSQLKQPDIPTGLRNAILEMLKED